MRSRAVIGILAVLLIVGMALPALAGTLSGDCTATEVSGTSFAADGSQVDAKTVATATQDDPFTIDPAGTVAWNASSDVPIQNHSWQIGLVIGGIEIQFFDGGDPNTAGTQTSTGEVSINDRLEELEFTQLSWVLDQLNGTFEAWGRINGDDDAGCDGRAWVEIDGSFGVFGLIGTAVAATGGAMIAGAGVKRKRRT